MAKTKKQGENSNCATLFDNSYYSEKYVLSINIKILSVLFLFILSPCPYFTGSSEVLVVLECKSVTVFVHSTLYLMRSHSRPNVNDNPDLETLALEVLPNIWQ